MGEENVEVNYAFFRGEGCIYVCAYVGDGQIVHYVCSSMCGLYVCVSERVCLRMHEKEKSIFITSILCVHTMYERFVY